MGDTVKTHIDLQRMQQEVWKLNNTFKANTHITIHIAFIIFNLEVLFDQVTDFMSGGFLCRSTYSLFVFLPAVRRHTVPFGAENSLSYRIVLADEVHLHIAGHIATSIPYLRKQALLRIITQIAHKRGL